MMKQVKFSDVKSGEYFWDTETGETLIKITENAGQFQSGGDYFEGGLATFDYDEIVEQEFGE